MSKSDKSKASDESASSESAFEGLGLSDGVLQTLREVGYEVPTPIQSKTIPLLLAGRRRPARERRPRSRSRCSNGSTCGGRRSRRSS